MRRRAAQAEATPPPQSRRTMRGRVYLAVDKETAKPGDVVDYVDGGWRTRKVVARRGSTVTVQAVKFQKMLVDRRRRVLLASVTACWRQRTAEAKTA